MMRAALGETLNLFYHDGGHEDRWVPFDRYPRAVVRRIVRGPRLILGLERVFLNLLAGLDSIGVPYRVNDYPHIRSHRDELACVIGKAHVLERIPRETPIIFGTAVHNHPVDAPTLFADHNILAVLVPCEWARKMFAVHWHDKVHCWPVGIDTERWKPTSAAKKDIDVLVYEKIRCHPERDRAAVRDPILEFLAKTGLKVERIVYGRYREPELEAVLARTKAMVFLCEHETQGLALQQTLSCGVPVFAWDLGGVWQDTSYYPHRVVFSPVSSVPYWDDRCGLKFRGVDEFCELFDGFWSRAKGGDFDPRSFILENLTLAARSERYVDLVRHIAANAAPHAGSIAGT
jgi:glycosyltransferase involved in cell wall biosynthesis